MRRASGPARPFKEPILWGIVTETPQVPPGVDPTKPSPARMYDYVLGGKHNFPVDREAAERVRERAPDLEDAAWVNRAFHRRAARWMAAERGLRQFVDIGSGLPTEGNTHGIVQRVAPEAHVVYVDLDPMVRAYACELLAHDGTTAVITADMRQPDTVLNDPGLRRLIDLDEPVGLLMTAVLHFVADDNDPWGLVARYMGALAPGSYLALSHATYDRLPPALVQASSEVYAQAGSRLASSAASRGRAAVRGPGDRAALRRGGRCRRSPRRLGSGRPRRSGQRRLPLVVRRGRPPSVTCGQRSAVDRLVRGTRGGRGGQPIVGRGQQGGQVGAAHLHRRRFERAQQQIGGCRRYRRQGSQPLHAHAR